ncbi:MAG: NADH-quinone oxidoreductase subunit F [Candidatus Cloacimonetes bacterium HGW-Cloacimonetes-1]|jgi:NADH:ubiquinone oxidoreductase subunit E|nr:MAG: NADH-quinone oxidoreductase subunit F [Candidatus Cloacimonetes bacterium HGW-Cloacimonetes-1]
MKRILICMGSSCFARENRENLRIIEDYLKSHGLTDSVHIDGSLCIGECSKGPNLVIDGTMYHGVDPEKLNEILDKELIAI